MGIIGFLVLLECVRITQHLCLGSWREQRLVIVNLGGYVCKCGVDVLGADQSRQMQDQMSGAAMAMPPDPKVAFKAEWEALEIIEHQWQLQDIESTVVADVASARG